MNRFDVIIIGGGVAGLSVAYRLAESASVLLLEQESQLAYHSTGRSAALYAASYGSQYPAIHALSNASNEFFKHPPQTLCDTPLLAPRGLLSITHREQIERLSESYRLIKQRIPSCRWLESDEISHLVPSLHVDYCQGAIYDPNVFDVDVHALLEIFRKGCLQNSGLIKTGQRIKSLHVSNDLWMVESETECFEAPVVVNAAGAWADHIANIAGITSLGIQPLRRSAILIDPPSDIDITDWPMVVELQDEFYFKPDAGKLLVSPADETPSAPCDSRPEQLDLAFAVNHAENALGYTVKKINHSWSGLRCFAKDRSPVVGFSDEKRGFFWLAGLGGYGIQTAPAMGSYAAALIMADGMPREIMVSGMKDEYVAPGRFSKSET